MGQVIEYFGGRVSALSYSEKYVLYFIDNNLEVAKELSLTGVADNVKVSTTTIIRMCQKLQLKGFSELKYVLKSIKAEKFPADEDILDRYQRNVISTISNIQTKDINYIAQLMLKADKIIIISVGLSKMIGEYLSKQLMQINKTSIYVYEWHIIELVENFATKNDLIIFVSSSGETKTLTHIAEKLTYQNVQTVSITNTIDSTLNTLTTYKICANSTKLQFAGYDVTARSTLMILIDMLLESYLVEKVKMDLTKA
ncbi:HTH-type transcriptional regulator GlvR [compost metagenome]